MLVRRGGARIVLVLAKTSGFQLSGRSGGLFENGVGELADELLLGSGECGDLVDLALQFGSRAAFGGGGLLAEEVLDGDLESLGDEAEGARPLPTPPPHDPRSLLHRRSPKANSFQMAAAAAIKLP